MSKVERVRDVGVVIPAAGSGERFGGPKAFVPLAGKPLILHSVETFASVEDVIEIVVASIPGDLDPMRDVLGRWSAAAADRWAAAGRDPPGVIAVPGGARRQDSVWAGIRALSGRVRSVLVHDAARPLISAGDIGKVILAIRETGAAVLGYPATDSVKEERDGRIARELARERIWLVQTPQGGTVEVLRRAFSEGERAGLEVTDEAGLLFASGAPVRLVEGLRSNLKITFPEDLALAEILLGRISGPRP
jgi:2-C-methyl-D-erythritol 4-phosphate cytidylyltransferase